MSDFTQALKYKKLSQARVMTQAEALLHNVRSGSQHPDKYYKVLPSRSLDYVFGYFTIPAFVTDYTAASPGNIIFQREISLPQNFYIKNLVYPPTYLALTANCAIFIKYRVGSTVYRYHLLGTQTTYPTELPSNKFVFSTYYPPYNRQLIGANCVIECVRMGDLDTPAQVGLLVDLKFETTIFRLPISGDEREYSIGTSSLKVYNDLKFSTTAALNTPLNAQFLDNTI